MSKDLKNVDPAVVKAAEVAQSGSQRSRPPAAQIVRADSGAEELRNPHSRHKLAKAVPSSVRLVKRSEEGSYSPPILSPNDIVLIHTHDNKYATIPKDVAAKCPLPPSDAPAAAAADSVSAAAVAAALPIVRFPFSSDALINVVYWCEKYGKDGRSSTVFAHPATHTDFSFMTSDDWEKYFGTIVAKNDTSLLETIHAAESLKIGGLVDFLAQVIGCVIRGKGDEELMAHLSEMQPASEEELANVANKYPWLDQAIAPI